MMHRFDPVSRQGGHSRRTQAAVLVCIGLLALGGMALLAGCGGGDSRAANTPGQAKAQTEAAAGAAPAQPPTPVAVEAVATGIIASHHTTTATLEADKTAEILARVAGVVRSRAVEEGEMARAGQTLLTIENDEYRYRAEQATAQREELAARFARVSEMHGRQLVTDEELQRARSELAAAEANEGLAKLNVSYTTVTAPFSGRLTRRLVDVGQTVSIGTPLFTLADFEPLLARVYVPAKEFRKLQVDQPVELRLDTCDHPLRGHIKLISPVIDPQSGTIKITVEIPSPPPTVRPGDFAQVDIVTERHESALLVPRHAVFSEKGEDVVYVAADSTAVRRVVALGFVDNDHAEIATGVTAGEQVVVKGQRSLKDGAPIKILEREAQPVAQNGGS